MDPLFQSHIEALPSALDRLLAVTPQEVVSLAKKIPVPGIYLLSEGDKHLYVGRAKNIGNRLQNHIGTWRQAAFAFQLAREETGKTKASYRVEGSRAALMGDPRFKQAFDQARQRVKDMDARYVEAADPIRQSLLEIYVAVALNTPYNDFQTH